MREMLKRDIELCKKCQFFSGDRKTGEHFCCTYYLDTHEHRMDDFDAPRTHNEWLDKCNKFFPLYSQRKRRPMTAITKNGIAATEAHRRYSEV